MQDYHQLEIWQRSMDYAVAIYGFMKALPETERYNLAAQLQRAATSVPLNIAEGAGCSTRPEFTRFLGYAYRSLKEVITCLELCQRVHASRPGMGEIPALIDEGSQIARMTRSLIQRLEGAHDELKTRTSELTTHNSQLITHNS